MTSMPPDTAAPEYAVVGSTGQQGGATTRALLERGVRVRALVRDPDSDQAQVVASLGAGLVPADLDDPDSLRQAFEGVAGVFAMTTFATVAGPEGEVVHGQAIGDAIVAAGSPPVVYSSVGGADRNTGIPHFESKWRVETYLRDLGLRLTVIRPTFFMENFTGYFAPRVQDDVAFVRAPLEPDVPLQMIATADIGRAAATALITNDGFRGQSIEIVGDELTATQVAEVFGAAMGRPARFERTPVADLGDDDQAAMFTWLARVPNYKGDTAATNALVPTVTTFPAFVAARQ